MRDRPTADLNERIAARVRDLRAARDLTLDALAERSGVSRAMISRVERGESSPTAAILDKLAAGLGVTLSALFDAPPATPAAPSPLARRATQPSWRDPGSGYRRRNLSPPGLDHAIQLVEVHVPARARVAYDSTPRSPRIDQQIWVLAGAIEVTVGRTRHRLERGDCLAMTLDEPTAFHNPTGQTARYLVALAAAAAAGVMIDVRPLPLPAGDADLEALAALLLDCVAGGASVSFMASLSREQALAFWRDVTAAAAAGERVLLVAVEPDGAIVGTVQLILAQPDNQPHRADLAKMLVHRRARRRGLGEQLMRAAEAAARDAGKSLLVLDTASAEAERLYARLGWIEVGRIPGYALYPDGAPCATTYFYKQL